MTRARVRSRGGVSPLLPSWTVTPENLPPGYVYTGGLRTQVNQDGSIGWAPHNLLSNSDLKTAGTSTLSVAESAGNVIDDGLDASVLDPLGGVGARKVTFNATSLVRLRPASGASSGYPGTPYSGRVWLRTTDGVARTLRFQVNDQPTFSSAGITVDGTWREFTRTATGTGNFQFIDIESDGGGFSLHLWGGHLNVGAAQPYLATTNSARFEPRTADYSDSIGTANPRRGIKIEPAATNLIRNSQCVGAVAGSPGSAPTNWLYAGRGAPVSTVGTGFEGAVGYVDVRIQGTLTDHNPFIDFESTTAAAGAPAVAQTSYVGHVHVRRLAGEVRPLLAVLRFGTEAGGYVNDGGGAASPVREAGSLYVVTAAPGATATRGILRLTINATAGSVIDMTLRISRPQMELGTVPTSSIPTVGSQVTRAADILYWPINFVPGYTNASGTFAGDFRVPTAFGGGFDRILEVTGANILIFRTGASSLSYFCGTDSNSPQRPLPSGAVQKTALRYGAGTFAVASTGSGLVTNPTGTMPASGQIFIANRPAGDRALNGSIYRLDYYPRAANDSQLQALTA